MFVQTIRAKTVDAQAVRTVVDRWMKELGPSATGWLGSTGGVTEDGQVFVLVRFDSEESARANSERPEQGEWWAEMEKQLDGEATFRDTGQVYVETVGDPDSAGFVQVMMGKSSNPERSRELMDTARSSRQAMRPDILGSVIAAYDDGDWTMVIYFVSEEAAREAESQDFEIPPDLKEAMEEMMSLSVGQPEYLDLKKPWLDSPQ